MLRARVPPRAAAFLEILKSQCSQFVGNLRCRVSRRCTLAAPVAPGRDQKNSVVPLVAHFFRRAGLGCGVFAVVNISSDSTDTRQRGFFVPMPMFVAGNLPL